MIENQQIFSEMLAHVPACTHRLPQNVLVIGDFDGVVTRQLSIHVDIETITVLQSQVCELDIFGHDKCSVVTQASVEFLSSCEEKSYDAVIINADVNEPIYDEIFYGLINRVLKHEGVFALKSPSAINEAGSFEDLCIKLGEYFKIIMPSFFWQKNSVDNIMVASKKYHPCADLILQRADLLEGLNYYNAEIHNASFVMPGFLRKRFKNIVKI